MLLFLRPSAPWRTVQSVWDYFLYLSRLFIRSRHLRQQLLHIIKTREPVPSAAVHAHIITLPPSCFTHQVSSPLWSLSHFFTGCYCRDLQVFCIIFYLLFNSVLVSLCYSDWPGLHLVINRLYLLCCRLLLIVDSDTDTPTPCRLFWIWML